MGINILRFPISLGNHYYIHYFHLNLWFEHLCFLIVATKSDKAKYYFQITVVLSMICYIVLQKNIESSLGRDPVKRAHGKVIVFAKVNGKLSFKIVE